MTDRFDKDFEKIEIPPYGIENKSRRKAVKTIVSGATVLAAYHVLPTSWNRPIIESIFLPAHAATSGTSLHDPCEVSWVDGHQDSNTVVIRVTGYVTPPTAGLATKIVATGNPDATATATVNTTTAADGTFSATMTLTTATGLGSVNVTTTVDGADGAANCSVNIPQRSGPPADVTAPSKIGESFPNLDTINSPFSGTMSFDENIAAVTSIILNISGDLMSVVAVTSGIGTSTLVISGTTSDYAGPGEIIIVVEDISGNSRTITSNTYDIM